MLSIFSHTPGIKIKFDEGMNSYTVVKDHVTIIYLGTKEMCKKFCKSYKMNPSI